MGPDLDLKVRKDSMVGMDGKENGGAFREPVAKNISCANNYQDNIFDLEASMHNQAEQVNQVEKPAVKIMECTHQSDNPLNEAPSQDIIENSSSFGNTASGDENDDTLSDSEVMSKLRDKGFGEDFRMRKKILTSHWRTFIQPCMWRCRWVELQIRRLLYQASKYDLQADAISRKKQLTSEKLTVDDTSAKSRSLSGGTEREKFMARRKRKRVEDSTDIAAYMEQHNLFSYFGSKRSTADVACMTDWANLGIPTDTKIKAGSVFGLSNEPVSLEFRNDDNSLEQVLWNIGVLQSHLSGLKTGLKKVLSENATEIYSADVLKLFDASISFPQSNTSANEGGKLVQTSSIASQLMPKCMCDVLKSKSAISTHGEAANLPDMIEHTDQLQILQSCEILSYKVGQEGDGHLIYNSTAKELNYIEKVEIQPTEKLDTPKEEQTNIVVSSVPVPVRLRAVDQPTPKIRSMSKLTSPNNKGKRGRRKAGRWNRRS